MAGHPVRTEPGTESGFFYLFSQPFLIFINMRAIKYSIILLMVLFQISMAGVNRIGRINQDFQSGRITNIQRLEYTLFSYFAQEHLPPEYASLEPGNERSLTFFFTELWKNRKVLSQTAREVYERVSDIPDNAETYTSPGGNFVIYYYRTGLNAVSSDDADFDNIPDYVETVAEAFEYTWDREVNQLGYIRPHAYYKSTTPASDRDKYKVVLLSLYPGYYGFTNPMGTAQFEGSYIELRSDFDRDNSFWVNSFDEAIKVTAAHEFFHAIQMTYLPTISDYKTWSEATAVYMEETVYPQINDYLQYTGEYLENTNTSLFNNSVSTNFIYGACLWPIFLANYYDNNVIKDTWENMGAMGGNPLESTRNALDAQGSTLKTALQKFAAWCYFSGKKAEVFQYFYEAEEYEEVKIYGTDTLNGLYMDNLENTVTVSGGAFKWHRLLVDNTTSFSIEFLGKDNYGTAVGSGWAVTVIAFDSTGATPPMVTDIQLDAYEQGFITISNPERYTEVAFAAVNTNTATSQKLLYSAGAPNEDTITLTSGENPPLVWNSGNFRLLLTMNSPVNTASAFDDLRVLTDMPDSLVRRSFGHYYELEFWPSIDAHLSRAEIIVSFNGSDVGGLQAKDLRMEQLYAYRLNETDSAWEEIGKPVIDYADSTLSFTAEEIGTFALFARTGGMYSFRPYPSPADFRKHDRVYVSMPNGKDLKIYSLDGMLVRTLRADRTEEYEVNRFVWNGKNRGGSPVNAGIYYIIGNDSTSQKMSKIMVIK